MTAELSVIETASPAAVTVLVVATVILVAAIVAHRIVWRSSARRHAVVLTALLTIGLCPVMVAAVRLVRVAGLTSLPKSSPDLWADESCPIAGTIPSYRSRAIAHTVAEQRALFIFRACFICRNLACAVDGRRFGEHGPVDSWAACHDPDSAKRENSAL